MATRRGFEPPISTAEETAPRKDYLALDPVALSEKHRRLARANQRAAAFLERLARRRRFVLPVVAALLAIAALGGRAEAVTTFGEPSASLFLYQVQAGDEAPFTVYGYELNGHFERMGPAGRIDYSGLERGTYVVTSFDRDLRGMVCTRQPYLEPAAAVGVAVVEGELPTNIWSPSVIFVNGTQARFHIVPGDTIRCVVP